MPFIGAKIINLNFDYCYKYTTENGKVKRTIDENLSIEHHEEADTKIIYHVCNIDFEANVLIRCADTDVLVIMLGNILHLKCPIKIWMEVGVGNKQRCIDVTQLSKALGNSMCDSLLGFHALTGCDYNAAFFMKGKKKPFQILSQHEKYQKALTDLANLDESDSAQVFEILEEYICRLYNFKKINDINQARFAMFIKTYNNSNNEKFSINVQNYDASKLPPCKAELQQHLLRASYIGNLWRHAHLQNPITPLLPTDYGWKEVEGSYEFVWFEGDALPTLINEIIIQPLNSKIMRKTKIQVYIIYLFYFFKLRFNLYINSLYFSRFK